jgi:hypothetical protein
MMECKQLHLDYTDTKKMLEDSQTRNAADNQYVAGEVQDGTNKVNEVKSDVQTLNGTTKPGAMAAHRQKAKGMETNVEDAEAELHSAEFIMDAVACPSTGGAGLVHKKTHRMMVGDKSDGTRTVEFADQVLQSKLERLQRGNGKSVVDSVLSRVLQKTNVAPPVSSSFLSREVTDRNPTGASAASGAAAEEAGNIPGDVAAKLGCTFTNVDCAELTDQMSLTWGAAKDAVDRYKAELAEEQQRWANEENSFNALQGNYNEISSFQSGKISDSEGQSNLISAEKSSLAEQLRLHEAAFAESWGDCTKDIGEILTERFCGLKAVRKKIVDSKGDDFDVADLRDCVMDDWAPVGECMKDGQPLEGECDDSGVGGLQRWERGFVTKNGDLGVPCPLKSHALGCGRKKCPVNCVAGLWTGWSSCSVECGEGIKARYRYPETPAQYGGLDCDTLAEVQGCNMGSCDQSCELHEWSPKRIDGGYHCSQACNPGSTTATAGRIEKFRHVFKKGFGNGKCAPPRDESRYQTKVCNDRPCYGDEECVAHQDLIIAIDGSGSISEEDHSVLLNFTGELLKKYRSSFKHLDRLMIGLVQFGNGAIVTNADGSKTVKGANRVLNLTHDLAKVREKVSTMQHQMGFTNMAQAFSAADEMFPQSGRALSQKALLIITDGKPSFQYDAQAEAERLRDKGIVINMAVVRDQSVSDDDAVLQQWVSEPSESHFLWVGGTDGLRSPSVSKTKVNEVLTTTCPDAVSALHEADQVQKAGWQQIRSQAYCGEWQHEPHYVGTADTSHSRHDAVEFCADWAAQNGYRDFEVEAFSHGHSKCFVPETEDLGRTAEGDYVCPSGFGQWQRSGIYRIVLGSGNSEQLPVTLE